MPKEDFLLEEYKSLKTEIFDLVAETRKLEIYAAGGVAALLAWFASEKEPFGFIWYIPVIIPVLGVVRATTLFWRVTEIAKYLRELERAFLNTSDKPSGWEHHFQEKAQSRISPSALIFWGLLLGVATVAPLLLT